MLSGINTFERMLLLVIKMIIAVFFILVMQQVTACGLHKESMPEMVTNNQLLEEVSVYYYDYFPYKKSYDDLHSSACRKYLVKSSTENRYALRCRQHAQLLRPHNVIRTWKKQEREKGYIPLAFNTSAITRVHAHIISTGPSNLSGVTFNRNLNKDYFKTVSGIFKRYTTKINKYAFKNLDTGITLKINATPDHPFYVINKKKFIPIKNILPEDIMLADNGQKFVLLCKNKSLRCSLPLAGGQPVLVYNLEINEKNTYFVSDSRILVHNCNNIPLFNLIGSDFPTDNPLFTTGWREKRGYIHEDSAKDILSVVGRQKDIKKTAFFIMDGALNRWGIGIDEKALVLNGKLASVEEVYATIIAHDISRYKNICIINSASLVEDYHSLYFNELAEKFKKIKKSLIYNSRYIINMFSEHVIECRNSSTVKRIKSLGDIGHLSLSQYILVSVTKIYAIDNFKIIRPR